MIKEVAMKLSINLSADEAAAVMAAIRFVEGNLSLNPDTCRWQFRNGKSFDCELSGLLALGYVAEAIDEAREECANRHPFSPYVHSF